MPIAITVYRMLSNDCIQIYASIQMRKDGLLLPSLLWFGRTNSRSRLIFDLNQLVIVDKKAHQLKNYVDALDIPRATEIQVNKGTCQQELQRP